MKRNDDLLRQLLLDAEASDDWIFLSYVTKDSSSEERERHGHVLLLEDAGLVAAVGKGSFRLTNQGHDFLTAIRDEGLWSKTKAAVAETGGNATVEILKSLASGFLKKKISQHTGIEL